LKTNFKKEEDTISKINEKETTDSEGENLTQEEFEEYIAKSGAKGSFMVYRSNNKDDELGLDEI
jgi:hypothetical protein